MKNKKKRGGDTNPSHEKQNWLTRDIIVQNGGDLVALLLEFGFDGGWVDRPDHQPTRVGW